MKLVVNAEALIALLEYAIIAAEGGDEGAVEALHKWDDLRGDGPTEWR